MEDNTAIGLKGQYRLSIQLLYSQLQKVVIYNKLFHQLNMTIKQKAFIYALYLLNKHSRAYIPMGFYRIGMSYKKKSRGLLGKKRYLIVSVNINNGSSMSNSIQSVNRKEISEYQYEYRRTFNKKSNVSNLVYYTIMKINTSKWKRQAKALKYRSFDISKGRISIKRMISAITMIVFIRKTEYFKAFIKALKRIGINDCIRHFKDELKQV